MKKIFSMGFQFLLLIVIIGFSGLSSFSQDSQVMSWNTFMGSSDQDRSRAIAVDGSGNVYVVGSCDATWGTPLNVHAGDDDAFVAKFNSEGVFQWNTFMGSSDGDWGLGIAVDPGGNVYVSGESWESWGTPLNSHAGDIDAFAAKLNSDGVLQWNTFMGGSSFDWTYGFAVDTTGNAYITGQSEGTWGTPVNPFSGWADAFIVKLNSNGALQWHTFMGTFDDFFGDLAAGLVADMSGNVYVTGYSDATWGTPLNAHAGTDFYDAFIAKLNSSGVRQWNTFMGGAGEDLGSDLALDESGNIYVTGSSDASWGTPLNAHGGTGFHDAFVAKLNSSGLRQWNTFMGARNSGRGIVLDGSGSLYVVGSSFETWGMPVNAHAGGYDAFAAKLNSSGALQWNTFLGSSDADFGSGIAMDGNTAVYVVGYSGATWGSPVNPHSGDDDAFIAKFIVQLPEPDIKANGSDSPIVITQGDALSVTIESDAGGLIGEDADWWILMRTDNPPPNKWLYFDRPTKSWLTGRFVTLQRGLFDLSSKKVPKTSGLAPGTYIFYFAVDMDMNGSIDVSLAYYDKVKVTINP